MADRLEHTLLVYCPLSQLSNTHPVYAEVLDVMLELPTLMVLGDFTIHTKTSLKGSAWVFRATMSHSGTTYQSAQLLDLVELQPFPLSRADHCLARFKLSRTLNSHAGRIKIGNDGPKWFPDSSREFPSQHAWASIPS